MDLHTSTKLLISKYRKSIPCFIIKFKPNVNLIIINKKRMQQFKGCPLQRIMNTVDLKHYNATLCKYNMRNNNNSTYNFHLGRVQEDPLLS